MPLGKKSGAEGDFVRKENCRYRKRSYKNKATPSGINTPPRRRRGGQDLPCSAATRRQGKAGSPGIYSLSHGVGLTTPPSCLWQDTVSRGGNRARSRNGANNAPFLSSQAAKSPPRRGKAFWSAARFVCRMTLYACHSSSHKTRCAIFAGALKGKKAPAHPQGGAYNKELYTVRKRFLAPYTGRAKTGAKVRQILPQSHQRRTRRMA